MTIEEKAKAYDEALERCKEWASGTWGHSVDDSPKDIAEFIFPQLAESEDERIRKTLIEELSACNTVGELKFRLPAPTREECIAWLEKQKEPENTSASTMIPSFHEELTEFELVLFNAVLDNNFVGAKGSENALAMTKKVAPELLAIAKKEPDWDREKCFVCQEYEKGFKQGHLEGCTARYNKAMKEVEQKEQKPAEWSEEDEGELQNAIDALEFLGKKGVYKSESGYDAALQAASWLKDLPERFNLQPKQEWNEEDEIMIGSLINYFEGDALDCSTEDVVNWLKSLRPQSKQKWSEEDSRMLSDIAGYISGVGSSSGITKRERVDFLYELPKRFNLQPKPEWSEEDKEKLKAICTYLRDYSRLAKLGDKLRFNEYCDFLESLRPQGSKDPLQPHWKPSEEQMDVLLNTEGMIRASGYPENAKVLASLYEALKKL